MEDLSEGLDVLMILERAYDKTMKVHTAAASGSSLSSGANKSDVGSTSEKAKERRFVRKEGEGRGMRCEDTRSQIGRAHV